MGWWSVSSYPYDVCPPSWCRLNTMSAFLYYIFLPVWFRLNCMSAYLYGVRSTVWCLPACMMPFQLYVRRIIWFVPTSIMYAKLCHVCLPVLMFAQLYDVCLPVFCLLFFFPLYFYGFLCICASAAPQRPAHGTVPSQVATHLRTDKSLPCAGEELDSNPGLLICSQVRYHWATSPPW